MKPVPDFWPRAARTLREIAKAAVAGEPYADEGNRRIKVGWGSSWHGGLHIQIGVPDEGMCPGRHSSRWSITVRDETTGECGVWDLRALRRELAAEVRGIVQSALF